MTDKVVLPNEVLLPEVERLLKAGSRVTLRTKGDSMLPFIRGGRDSVVLAGQRGFGIGDIVLARIAEGHYVLHRIRKMEGDTVTLMGDGNLKGVEVCRVADLCGKAVAIVRNGSYVDPYAAGERRKVKLWYGLLPWRRYLLAVYRRLFL